MTTSDDLCRLTAESRRLLASVEVLRERQRLITAHSRARVDASRLLLSRRPPRV